MWLGDETFFRDRVRDSRDSTLGAKKRCLFKSVAFRFGFRVRDSTLGAKKCYVFWDVTKNVLGIGIGIVLVIVLGIDNQG